jgi:hypothetical protein
VQLQRIISRSQCQIFYAGYGDLDEDIVVEVPRRGEQEEFTTQHREEGVDTLTLLHHDINICTNSVSYLGYSVNMKIFMNYLAL